MIWVPIIIIVAMAVSVTVVVYLITRKRLREIAREKARKEVAARITKAFKKGDYHVVHVGLLDARGRQTKKIEVRGDEIADDVKVGDVLTLRT